MKKLLAVAAIASLALTTAFAMNVDQSEDAVACGGDRPKPKPSKPGAEKPKPKPGPERPKPKPPVV